MVTRGNIKVNKVNINKKDSNSESKIKQKLRVVVNDVVQDKVLGKVDLFKKYNRVKLIKRTGPDSIRTAYRSGIRYVPLTFPVSLLEGEWFDKLGAHSYDVTHISHGLILKLLNRYNNGNLYVKSQIKKSDIKFTYIDHRANKWADVDWDKTTPELPMYIMAIRKPPMI